MARVQPIILVASLLANAALVFILVIRDSSDGSPGDQERDPQRVELCEKVAADIDFFIHGLENGQDPFYSPLIVRTLAHALAYCNPAMADELETSMHFLRRQLLYLVSQNVGAEQKTQARDEALEAFRHLKRRLSR